MHLPMHAHRCRIHNRAFEDCQMCQHHSFLLDKRGIDDRNGSVNLYSAFPLGSQAANFQKTENRLGCYARARSFVSHVTGSYRRRH